VVVGAEQRARASFCGLATALTLRVIGDAFSLRTVIGTGASAAHRLSGTSFIGTQSAFWRRADMPALGLVWRFGPGPTLPVLARRAPGCKMTSHAP
jgi:hypothetical protein